MLSHIWVKSESDLNQISTRSWLVLINSDAFITFNYLEYDDCTLMNDLQNKINNRLQNTLSVCSKNFTSLTRLRIFLQDVNSKQRVNYQLCSERCTVIIKVTVEPDKCATSLSVTTLIIDYVKLTISSISKSARSSIICYICKIFNHLFKNCF